tara:strand:- start:587 stop:1564 length:978 start_codon:yes stop_codon:yes gene_type:complete
MDKATYHELRDIKFMKLLLLGCTGFVGQELIPTLLEAGHQLTIVSRYESKNYVNQFDINKLEWIQIDPSQLKSWDNTLLIEALKNNQGIINLVGEPITEQRWTSSQLKIIEDTRLNTTRGMINAMNKSKKIPKILVNASAIGFYGNSQTNTFKEEDKSGNDFLSKLCEKWEDIAYLKPRSTKLVIVRIGIVLGNGGGALGKMLPIFKAGLGGPIGDGMQWMSWIHRSDLCRIIKESLVSRKYSGVINAVAPNPVRMKEFSATLGRSLGRPSIIPVPGGVLKLILGDGAKVVLEGQKVKSNILDKIEYKFIYPTVQQAIENIIKYS